MNKYAFGRITFAAILTVVMFSIGFKINTWQFWVVYGCAWMMSFMTFLEVEAIHEKKLSIENISKINTASSEIDVEKHGSYYYTETCPTCGCIFHYTPHELGFSYTNIGEENETSTEWIYCPECAHKFEWNEGYHKKLNY